MKKLKQILALLCVVLLVAMYGCTLVFALMSSPYANGLFWASLFCTIVVPVFLYAYIFIYKYLKDKNKPEPVIKNVVFDVGRVLVDFSWGDLFANTLKFDQKTGQRLEKAMFLNPIWNEVDRGVMTDAELLDAMCSSAPDLDKEIRLVYEHLEETIHLRSYVIPWLTDLKKRGYHLYVLSNYGEKTYLATKDNQLRFQSLMDGCIWSYQWKVVKPDPAIYRLLTSEYGIKPEESVFLDDRKENIEAAASLGFSTILFTEYQSVQKQLSELLSLRK